MDLTTSRSEEKEEDGLTTNFAAVDDASVDDHDGERGGAVRARHTAKRFNYRDLSQHGR